MIRNVTRKKILCSKTELAGTAFQLAKGLMFRKNLDRDSGMLMRFNKPGRHGIWMLFMRFPIDVVFIDSESLVTGIFENIRPVSLRRSTWKICRPEKPAKYALELAAGRIRETNTKVGDSLKLIEISEE